MVVYFLSLVVQFSEWEWKHKFVDTSTLGKRKYKAPDSTIHWHWIPHNTETKGTFTVFIASISTKRTKKINPRTVWTEGILNLIYINVGNTNDSPRPN